MYISTDNFVPLTPASSQGSSATILPSLSVASSKNYKEPERGRSLSRSSSSSWTSGSGAMLLSPRSSVYSATPTPAHPTSYNVQYSDFSPFGNERRGQNAEPRYYPYVHDPLRPLPPPPPSSLQTPQVFTDIRGTNPCSYRPAYVGVNGVQCSVPSTSSSGGAATVQDSKGYSGDISDIFSSRLQTNEELSWPPMRPPVAVPKVTPSSSTASPFDWWGPVRQTSAPDTGLFGPRTPRDSTEPELQSTAPPSPKSPPRPLSRVTERTERTEIASAQAVSPPVPHLHPYSQHIAPIGKHSSDSPRGKVRQDTFHGVKAPTRSTSPEEYSPQPSPTTAHPAPIALSPYRLTTASSTSHVCSCCSTVVIQAGPHTPPPMSPPIGSRLSIRSRSRSSSRSRRSPIIISDREILNSPRSCARTRTPEIQNPIIITPQIPEPFAARVVRASRRSRSRSPQGQAPPIPRDIVQRHERSRSHSPAFCRRSHSRSSPPSPRVYRVAPRSRSPRRYGSPQRSRSPRPYGSPRRSPRSVSSQPYPQQQRLIWLHAAERPHAAQRSFQGP
ncbi:hypothetical protein B0H11DRAFT_1278387 [Mycena galericulata]|nr:hypothetical protein B0H11DRAFT_1278387 [Mycena galericulata]